ncbi:MAG: hypothetical protein JWQ94_776 [Tardiphaga sp.]|nr:hypothetical protein [Tardiphaga sp.]
MPAAAKKTARKTVQKDAKKPAKQAGRKAVANRAESPDVWATRILLHSHAIAPCAVHGFMKLKFHHAAIDYAHALAAADPLPGTSKAKSAEILDGFLDGLSDDCPAC